MQKNLGVTAYAAEFPTNRFTHWNQNIRFGRVVFEKSQKVSKTVKSRKYDFSEGHYFLCTKKLGVTAYAAELPITHSTHWNQNLRFGRIVFEKSQKVSKTVRKLTSLRVITFLREKICV